MKIVHIIGNGFDINLGLETKYRQFYDHYCKIESSSELVKNLKKDISSGITDWSDLEIAFGKHTVKLNDIKEFDIVFEDIVDNLGDYLIAQEEKLDATKIDSSKFYKYLYNPEIQLSNDDIAELKRYRQPWNAQDWNIDIITLNYTRTIERILGDEATNIKIGAHHQSKIIFRNIHHIHGYTDIRTVLGVNDISQIAKKEFHENEEILEALIKTKCNRVQRHSVDRTCERLINEANLIVIFGSSIGDTDTYWWQLIGEQLKRGTRLIIFKKGEEIKKRFGQKVARSSREIKKAFFDKTNLTAEEKAGFSENVYVGINTDMFNLL